MPVQKTLNVWQGNTLRIPLSIKYLVNGVETPFDLTGSTLVFKATWPSGTLRKTTGSGAGFTITDAANGAAELVLSVAETRAMSAGLGRYEIERQTSSEQFSLLYGDLIIEGWVSDD